MGKSRPLRLIDKIILVLIILCAILFLNFNFTKPLIKKFFYSSEGLKDNNFDINESKFLEEIKNIIAIEFPDGSQLYRGIIHKKEDITGDNIPEFLVETGRGGASTISLALIQIENKKPRVAYFKLKNGTIDKIEFMTGSGGSGRYGFDVEFNSSEKLIYSIGYSAYNTESDFCDVEAYAWSEETKIFEYNEKMSGKYREISCKKICKSYENNDDLKTYFQKICKDYWK